MVVGRKGKARKKIARARASKFKGIGAKPAAQIANEAKVAMARQLAAVEFAKRLQQEKPGPGVSSTFQGALTRAQAEALTAKTPPAVSMQVLKPGPKPLLPGPLTNEIMKRIPAMTEPYEDFLEEEDVEEEDYEAIVDDEDEIEDEIEEEF